MGRTTHRDVAATAGVWQVASLLLAYPDETLLSRFSLLDDAVAGLPADAAGPLAEALDYVRSTPLPEQQESYVATFDMRKKCCPYLTWWVHGDTRNRGYALVEIKATFRQAGVDPPSHELPDHVAVVLEFAALVDPSAGGELLTGHRSSLEALRSALHKSGSVYGRVLDAVVATLPGTDVPAPASVPPVEMVGYSALIMGDPRSFSGNRAGSPMINIEKGRGQR